MIAGASRSGYYNYASESSRKFREKREKQDEVSRQEMLKAYHFKGRKKGA